MLQGAVARRAGCRKPIDPTRGTPPGPAIASTAGLLARGSVPVTAFPGWSQWRCGSGSPLTVAGAAAELGVLDARTAFPVRSQNERPSIGPLKEAAAALSTR